MKKFLLFLIISFCGANAKAQIVYTPFIPKPSSEPAFSPLPTPAQTPTQSQIYKTKDEVNSMVAYSIKYDRLMDIQVITTTYSNNTGNHKIIGVKNIVGDWQTADYELMSLSYVLTQVPEELKSFILGMSEYGTHYSLGWGGLLVGLNQDISTQPVPFQNQDALYIMSIDYAMINGNDYTSTYKGRGELYIYAHNDRLMLANKYTGQSFGFIYDESIESVGQSNIMKGIWEYHNSYDDKTGVMYITLIANNETGRYELTMTSPNFLEKVTYRGYAGVPSPPHNNSKQQRSSVQQNILRKDSNFKIE